MVASCIHYAIVAVVFAAQLALNYPSNLQLEGPSFWSCEALGKLPTPPKAKAGTDHILAPLIYYEKFIIKYYYPSIGLI